MGDDKGTSYKPEKMSIEKWATMIKYGTLSYDHMLWLLKNIDFIGDHILFDAKLFIFANRDQVLSLLEKRLNDLEKKS